MEHIIISLKIISFIIGVTLIYFGTFLYENEEKKIKNHLEDFWIKLDDISTFSLTFHKNLFSFISKFIFDKLRNIFGNNIISKRTLNISFLLSFSSIYFCLGLSLIRNEYIYKDLYIENNLTIGIICLSIAYFYINFALSSYSLSKAEKTLYIFISAILSLLLLYFIFLFSDITHGTNAALLGILLIMLSMLLSDFIFIIVSLKLLKSIVKNHYSSILLLSISTVLIICLVILPFVFSEHILQNTSEPGFIFPGTDNGKYGNWGFSINLALLTIPFSSIPAILISSIFFLVILSFYLHRIIWPLISRPIYTLQRFGVIGYKKVFIFLGVFFIGILFPDITKILSELFK